LATTLYVQREIESVKEEDIINGVVSIKGTKYSQSDIGNAVKELVDNEYFTA
jgi:outer membrane protein assembly factor BamA